MGFLRLAGCSTGTKSRAGGGDGGFPNGAAGTSHEQSSPQAYSFS
jgi:hypothetical protein